MTGAQEVPGPGDPDGTATGTLSIDPSTNKVSWNFTYANIAAPTLMHIHTGAAGVAGPVLVNLGVATTGGPGTLINMTTTTAANVNMILANPTGFYVNIHNAPFPAGAVRGQLMPVPDPTWKWVGTPGPVKEWTNPANWMGGNGGGFPNNPDAKVLLGDTIQEDTTINNSIPITISTLSFGSEAHSYTLGSPGGAPISFENPGLTPIKMLTPRMNIICTHVLHSCLELSGVPASSLVFKGPITGIAEGPASIIMPPVNVCEIILKAKNMFTGSVLVNGGVLVLDEIPPPQDAEGGPILIDTIPDDVALSIGPGGLVSIGAGRVEIVGSLILAGVMQPPGLYGDATPGIDGGGFIKVPAPCPADLNDDGTVDGADLGAMLAQWGATGMSSADLNDDGVVDGADLGALLAAWGPC
ncbi:MAG: CHRD domain-containing protein [Phycisphaerales bacterium]